MAHEALIAEIETFLAGTGMGEAYFGQKAVGNSKLVRRLRSGRPIETITADRVRSFIRDDLARRSAELRSACSGAAA